MLDTTQTRELVANIRQLQDNYRRKDALYMELFAVCLKYLEPERSYPLGQLRELRQQKQELIAVITQLIDAHNAQKQAK
jgi:hypothetical protein